MAGLSVFQYLLSIAVVLSGIAAGALLSAIAPEELRHGRKYFWFLLNGIIVLMAAMLMKFMSWDVLTVNIAGFVLFFALVAYTPPIRYYWAAYALAVLLLYFARQHPMIFVLEASLLFLLSMPLATLHIAENTEIEKVFG